MGRRIVKIKPANIQWLELTFSFFPGCLGFVESIWTKSEGWSPLYWKSGHFSNTHIACLTDHYGIGGFEGLKVFTFPDGSIWCFRPQENARRFRRTAEVTCMEPFPEEMFLEAIKLVAMYDRMHIPPHRACRQGASFYVRHVQTAVTGDLGVKPADSFRVRVFGCPVGPYFKAGFGTIGLHVTNWDRVPPNGIGDVKAIANYGSSIPAYMAAKKFGCTPIFRDPIVHQFFTEGMASNMAFIFDGVYVTPRPSRLILPSITNASIQTFCPEDLNIAVQQTDVEWQRIRVMQEAAGIGTGAGVAPVGWFVGEKGEPIASQIDRGKPGPIMTNIYHHLHGIQVGKIPDHREWMWEVAA